MNLHHRRQPLVAAILAAILVLPAACGPSGPGDATLRTVPTPADYVSGGTALVRLEVPGGIDSGAVTLTVNGVEVPGAFREAPPDPLGRLEPALLALVTGLDEGSNRLEAAADGRTLAALTVTNYPATGPIFSGERLEPYFCLGELPPGPDGQPRRFAVGNGAFIDGEALDEACHMETRVDYLYRTAGDDSSFEPLPDPRALPPDVARITTSLGEEVPYVVRLETGTLNRAIYQTAVIVDPDGPEPDPWNPPRGWNGRLVYTFGGGCEAGFFQGTSTGGVLRDDVLSLGYGIASSTLNVNAQGGCNDPLSAETALMVKERFAETVGPPVHTIGMGGSGGAMQQLLIAGAYPGILDGILPTLTFPDAVSYFIDTAECRLPLRRFLNGRDLDDETKRVIGGWAVWETCDRSLGSRPSRIGPGDCPAQIPEEARYHPTRNPTGVRCSIYDGMRNVFGTRIHDEIDPPPQVPFARSPHDNVGVQYGLEALNAGLISTELFLDLNEEAGGWDIDFQWRPERTRADSAAVRAAYETGRVTSGAGGLAVTPIIDERSYLDDIGDFHTSYYSFVMRARLVRDNGHADNYVIHRRPRDVSLAGESLARMDEWLTNLARDGSDDPRQVKVVRAKPDDLVDACWNGEGERIDEPQRFDEGRLFDNTEGACNRAFPIHTGPRMVAGGPLANDVLQCRLKPPDPADYAVELSGEEWERLEAIFPEGVCDWSRPGVGQDVDMRTWVSFGPSPVNRYDASPSP